LASVKKLAGETIWYGLSNIAAKFLNVLLTPILTHLLNTPSQRAEYGESTVLFACISFVNIIFTYGMETGYFRFSNKGIDKDKLFQTSFTSLVVSSIVFSCVIILAGKPICGFIGLGNHTEYIVWAVAIVAVDTLAAIPFAKLRQEGKPKKYAFARVAGILVNISLTVYLVYYAPKNILLHPYTSFAKWYQANTNVGFLILANLAQSVATFLFLSKEWGNWKMKFERVLWSKIMRYSWPMVIIGLGGMINETIDRIMLPKMILHDHIINAEKNPMIEVGIYSANYKIAIIITLFIQAFKMGAEPFFFNHAKEKDAKRTYARVMKWFVITLCIAFLSTALFLDVWKNFIGPKYHSGLGVVPILLGANFALGVYYNLSVWYKITDKMYMGMVITMLGGIITVVLNCIFIPRFGMFACAWTTLITYFTMMVMSFRLGQRYYKVPYPVRKLTAYTVTMLLLFFAEQGIRLLTEKLPVRLFFGALLFAAFIRLVLFIERKEMKTMPIIGKLIK
jgi:O-antigen/teichoic acid export membrane protein